MFTLALVDMVRIANCSGFYGDRQSAPREMLEDGPIDILTGDYLAELTLAILWRTRERRPDGVYARTFLAQMNDILADCLTAGVRVVSNAGGLAPQLLATELRQLAGQLGLEVSIAAVTGDDLIDRLDLIEGIPLGRNPVTANVYLGGWGIARALDEGADVVVTGRVTDAALVIGPAASAFGWAADEWDSLAGALVAGHVIECGAQVTGGNFSFFTEIPGRDHIGFPLVEMHPDGSFVVTKHPGTGGAVTVETVTAQLLYEIGGPRYLNPDVTARFDTIRLVDDGFDRVRVVGVRGEPPPPTSKVAVNSHGGYRNSVTFVLTGLDIGQKAEMATSALWASIGPPDQFEEVGVHLLGGEIPDPIDNNAASAFLQVTVRDPDPKKVGRAFSKAAVEQALAGYPGLHFTAPPADATPVAVYHPGWIRAVEVTQMVDVDGRRFEVVATNIPKIFVEEPRSPVEVAPYDPGPTVRGPLGRLVGARSGDKGGSANVGVWARSPETWPWIRWYLTTERLRSLLVEANDLVIERHVFEQLFAVNFVVKGLLGEGVASSTRADAQAKSLGEYLRSRYVDLPERLLTD